MQHLMIAAAATALAIGAGSGAVATMSGTPATPPVEMANPMIAGAAMLPQESILQNAAKSPEHASFLAEIWAAGLNELLDGAGSYTVFAPTDAAYATLGKERMAALMKSAQRNARYLVVKGRYDSTRLLQLINEQGGQVKLRTLEGGVIVAKLNGPTNILLMDENGAMADISIYDIQQKNGVLQVIDRVLTPGKRSQVAAS